MARFNKDVETDVTITQDVTVEVSTEVTVSDAVDIEVNINISAEEFYDAMTPPEMNEMAKMLHGNGNMNLMDILNPEYTVYAMSSEDKAKFYKDLAYHVGMTDSEYLDELIEDLGYWKRER